jgi:hypothetical protein
MDSEPAHTNVDDKSSSEPGVVSKNEQVVSKNELEETSTATPDKAESVPDGEKELSKESKESKQNIQAEARRRAQEVGRTCIPSYYWQQMLVASIQMRRVARRLQW